jgi:hypothetical protein
MTITKKTNHKTDSSKEANITTNQTEGSTYKAHNGKRTAKIRCPLTKKGNLQEITTTQGWIR